MDRQIVFTGAIPQTTDLLKSEKNTMNALGYALQAFLGPCSSAVVDGLALAATTPASLSVTVGSGSIHSSQVVDQTAYGDLGTDTTHTIVKQGLLLDPVTLTVTPPATSGYSQNYLVQVIYSDVDGGSLVLPYYNAANPSVPFAGPANAGTSNYTVRQGKLVVQLKAGTAATTGSQTTPSPDAGYTGLYVITVANGATSVTSSNFSTLSTAPFIPTKLPTLPADVQSGKWVFGTAGGTSTAYTLTLSPAPSALTTGMVLMVYFGTANTTTSPTLNVNALGAKSIVRQSGNAPAVGDVYGWRLLTYDGTNWRLLSRVVSDLRTNRRLITASATYTPTAGTVFADVELVGGGGGGGSAFGSASPNVSAGTGGGGGGYARKLFTAAQIGAAAGVVIGAGGSGGVAGQNYGSAGGTTIFSPTGTGSAISAVGGNGGKYGITATQVVRGDEIAGGGGGIGGDINIPGSASHFPVLFGGSSYQAISGRGGDSVLGKGGQSAQENADGNPGQGYGSGGSGGGAITVSRAGGLGGVGVCIVTEYIQDF